MMVGKRSPRYPRLGLGKAVELAERLYKGAHRSRVDADTAARVIGYSNSSSGAAAVALGALRQFGLVDGLRGDVQISDVAMRILQPMDEQERIAALNEAAKNPEIFGLVLAQFSGEIPRSDEPIKAYLVRQQGFSQGGAEEVASTLRETFSGLPMVQAPPMARETDPENLTPSTPADSPPVSPTSLSSAQDSDKGELIVLPLGASCKAELRFVGEVTSTAYDRLIRHLGLLRDMLVEDAVPES
jgi:hypothetical protein